MRPLRIISSSIGKNPLISSSLSHQREVFRKPQDLGGVKPAGCTKTHWAAQNGSSGKVQLTCLEHDGFVQRRSAEFIIFANENPEQQRLFWDLHG
jgi:hypothetical protein